MPGELLTIQLPNIAGLEVVLNWQIIPGAAGYRLYKTPAPNMNGSAVGLLTEIVGQNNNQCIYSISLSFIYSVIDDGSLQVNASIVPLPVGSLGVWNLIGSLNTSRLQAATVATPNPMNTSSEYFLLTFGGLDPSGNKLATWEHCKITLIDPSLSLQSPMQTVSSSIIASTTITARSNLRAIVLNYLYVLHVKLVAFIFLIGINRLSL